ncbi:MULTISPECIES: FeoA family protein [unclassified Mycobacterium]|uniref:FeoA family protein n=1 Tax=unclassified Mycobacterium TaxID=2642494 RepID=UPI00274210FB|nr:MULTISPECIES: FeoA family protein [unclassified Mycobacterium]MDP7701411.1 FeoA family protein [Mycobacterium sp. TY815]MDP7724256.1 FeoA family protein [Mycobacterium sp. TY814]
MPNSRLERSAPKSRPGQDRRPTLADLAPGTGAEIVAFDPAIAPDIANRLRHLGFRPGVQVIKLRTAPLGDPAVYRLLGYDTCLRRREAAQIEITEQS